MAAVPQHRYLLVVLFLAVAAVLQQVASAAPLRAYPASSSYRCGWCPRRSTASLLPPDAGVLAGAACGYVPGATTPERAEEGFHIAAVSASLFRDGRACGACYQLRCRGRAACADQDGVKVVVVADDPETNRSTNGGGGGRFLLTKDAFDAMMITPNRSVMSAHHGDVQLASLDTVDVDFRRIPCVYRDKNLAVKVEEPSVRSRGRLALRFLYQGGQTDIAAVEVAQAGSNSDTDSAPSLTMWQYMTRREGSQGVWRTSRAPAGPLRLRIVVTAGSGGKWLRSDGAVLPTDWVSGGVYDTGLRIADVAASTCGAASCAITDEDGDGDEELR